MSFMVLGTKVMSRRQIELSERREYNVLRFSPAVQSAQSLPGSMPVLCGVSDLCAQYAVILKRTGGRVCCVGRSFFFRKFVCMRMLNRFILTRDK